MPSDDKIQIAFNLINEARAEEERELSNLGERFDKLKAYADAERTKHENVQTRMHTLATKYEQLAHDLRAEKAINGDVADTIMAELRTTVVLNLDDVGFAQIETVLFSHLKGV